MEAVVYEGDCSDVATFPLLPYNWQWSRRAFRTKCATFLIMPKVHTRPHSHTHTTKRLSRLLVFYRIGTIHNKRVSVCTKSRASIICTCPCCFCTHTIVCTLREGHRLKFTSLHSEHVRRLAPFKGRTK